MDQANLNLTVAHISDAIKIIDYAAEQGAFRGWTVIRQVIALRDHLEAFVTAANATNEAPIS